MRCSKCRALLHHSKFDEKMKDNWISVKEEAPAVVCINCQRGHCNDKRQDISQLHCDHCARRGDDVPTDWPEGAFFADDVSNWRLHKTPLKCAACKLEAGEIATKVLSQVCQKCEKSVEFKGPPHGYSPILVREFLEGGKTVHQGSRIFKDRWRCFDCQYPQCKQCKVRPKFAGPSHTCYTKEGEYMCPRCRYPPCAGTGCTTERPKQSKYSVERIKVWICPSCQLAGNTDVHTCHGKCQRQLPAQAFDHDACRRPFKVCRDCQHPACAACGQKSTEIWTPNPMTPNEVYRCAACEKGGTAGKHPHSCKTCGETNLSSFDKRDRSHLHDRCRNCQYPLCSKCGQRSTEIWTPHPKIPNEVYKCSTCTGQRQCTECLRGLPPLAMYT